jgi:hypothetical protein
VAHLALVLATSHSPFLYATADEWEEARSRRAALGSVNAKVPIDSIDANREKQERCMRAFGVLRERLEAAKPDVLLIFGDDQGEQFDFTNFPAFGLFVGDSFEGYKVSKSVGLPATGVKREIRPRTPEHWSDVKGHPGLARHLLGSLVEDGFDLAFSTELARKEEGIGHAFMRPSYYIRPEYDVPTIPFFVNCYFSPQPTGRRCYQLGRSVRAAVESYAEDLNVAVIGSGGLWHTPGAPNAYLDEGFDNQTLEAVRTGNARAMAEHVDRARPAVPTDPAELKRLTGGTNVPGGIGSGTGETRNWIIAAAVADGQPGTVVDYVPVYASPCGMGFAYWEQP